MNQTIRVLNDEIRRERIYVLLLASFLIGAAGGTLLCAGLYRAGDYALTYMYPKSMISCFLKQLLWVIALGILSLHPSGTCLIPLTFLSKGLLVSCRVTGILLFSDTMGLFEVLLLHIPDILYFLLIGSMLGEWGIENSCSLLKKRPALHGKNLYVLANRRTATRLVLILVAALFETALETYIIPYLLK